MQGDSFALAELLGAARCSLNRGSSDRLLCGLCPEGGRTGIAPAPGRLGAFGSNAVALSASLIQSGNEDRSCLRGRRSPTSSLARRLPRSSCSTPASLAT